MINSKRAGGEGERQLRRQNGHGGGDELESLSNGECDDGRGKMVGWSSLESQTL